VHTITRRRFLIASGTAGVAAAAAGTGLTTWRTLANRAAADPLPIGSKILVIVTLYGGNDGLNMVIPYQDSAYHDARPDFAYNGEQVLRLDDTLGLNPAMNGTSGLWAAGQLAVVRGVGYPQPDRSHFRSMDIWQTASPATPVSTSWIGRWLDATGDDPVRAVNIGPVLPPLAVGAKGAAAALAMGNSAIPPDLASAITGLGRIDVADTPEQVSVATSYCSERTAAATFAQVQNTPTGTATPGVDQPTAAALGRRPLQPQAAIRPGRQMRQGRGPDHRIHRQPRRIRHPRGRERHPGNTTHHLGLGHGRVPQRHGDRRMARTS